jgi:hypothetical protein
VYDRNGEVAGLIFTTTWGESPLAACANNRPCEVTSSGTVSPDETSYSVPLINLAACFNSEGRFDLNNPACPLDPGRQFNLAGYPLSAVNPNQPGAVAGRPPQTSWNTRVSGPDSYLSYKISPIESTDCRSAEGYGAPVRVLPSTLIDDPFPRTDARLLLCTVGGATAAIDPSWQPFRFASQARVAIDTIPPAANPSANINPGDPYIVLFEYLANEISFYQYKVGPPGATDCSDPAGYRAFVQRLFLSRANEPYQVCAIPIDSAENPGKPWGFILHNVGFLDPASRASTSGSLVPAAMTAVTGDFPALPDASLSAGGATIPLTTARRDRGEIWLSLPEVSPTNTAIVRLADDSGAIGFPIQVARGAPGIFTLDGSGTGAPAGYLALADGSLQFLSKPVRVDPALDTLIEVYVNSTLHPALSATLGGRPIEIVSASSGRLRLRIPAAFPPRGALDLVLRAGTLVSNTAQMILQ